MTTNRGPLVVGLSGLALAFSLAGCGGSSTALAPVGPNMGPGPTSQTLSPLALAPDRRRHRHRPSCKASSNELNFNATPIKIGDYLWFASVFKVPGGERNRLQILVTNSIITFSTSKRSYTVKVPDMRLELSGRSRVRLAYAGRPDSWELLAPPDDQGRIFLDGVPFRVDHYLPGDVKNVTWTGKFYGNEHSKINWQWGAGVYTQFSNNPGRLGVKPVRFRNGNNDQTGTPENFKQWLIAGGTGKGGRAYHGKLGDVVSVSLCR
jgi:hypothetical protein